MRKRVRIKATLDRHVHDVEIDGEIIGEVYVTDPNVWTWQPYYDPKAGGDVSSKREAIGAITAWAEQRLRDGKPLAYGGRP